MPDPTNPNPRVNQDSTTSQTTNDPNSWASPKDSDGDGFVKLRQDDLHPERIERLGQYLTDHSSGNIAGPDNDNSNDRGSHFPIENPERQEYAAFQNTGHEYTDLLDEFAEYYFQNLRHEINFTPGVGGWEGGARENSPRVQDGHTILRDGADIVKAHMEDAITNSGSRWAGIGRERFPPNQGDPRYQVQRAGPHLDGTGIETFGTRFKEFQHLSGQTNAETITNAAFWDEYFTKLGQVGARITLGSTGYTDPDDAADLGAKGSVRGGGGLSGAPEDLSALEGNYKRVPLSNMQPGEAFSGDFPDMELKETFSLTGESYGQLYSWADPYEKAQFIGSNRALTVAGQLLEIWAMVQLRVLVVITIFQAASMLLSQLQAPGDDTGLSNKEFMKVPWNRNYYHPKVQEQPGNAFMKGQSGFNHSPVDIIERALEELNEVSANVDNYVGFLVPQLAGGLVNQTGIILQEEYLNFTRGVLREINIYIPRHTLSTSANVSGYNDGGGLRLIQKGIDVATAYTRASAAGLGSIASHIITGDYGQSLGFWRNIFRNVVRSKALLQEIDIHEGNSSAFESVLKYVGKDDKIMRFVNYLAMIGDMDIGRGHAGKLAFPENKVVLDQVSNFPTLRTASTRIKSGPNERSTDSRLGLTQTPSLYLMPKSIRNIRLRLEDYGIEKSGSAWGQMNGQNNLANKEIKDEDKDKNIGQLDPINERWQARATSRFSADQVRRIEDQLEAEHVPFYIQDLRTNEIISFHAFLTSISDSYAADWNGQKGFGRLEAAQIYGGGSRSIAVSFSMVPMNEEDFDEMYVKINKLTTLVYPQWSEGTTISTNSGTFVQPFSQVPTASPLCRIRVGDLFTSNYSKQSMARMMGIGKSEFTYANDTARTDDSIPIPNEGETKDRRITRRQFRKFIRQKPREERRELMEKFNADATQFETSYDANLGQAYVKMPTDVPGVSAMTEWFRTGNIYYYLYKTVIFDRPAPDPVAIPFGGGSDEPGIQLSDLFSNKNPIFKAFESTMGRGIVVAVTSIDLDWKLNSAPWELTPGHRAPRMCDVSLGITPIHDITPGIDHEGFNRAPIYKVGKTSKSFGGDVWYNAEEYGNLVEGIETQHEKALEGREEEDE